MMIRNARTTGPIRYKSEDGQSHEIPVGPCLIEQLDDSLIVIIWGINGQCSAAMSLEDVKAAEEQGNFLLLD